jgi:glycolate oxidase FAD binding subunit
VLVRSPLTPLAIELLNAELARAAGLDIANGYGLVCRVGGYPAAVERLERDLPALLVQHGGVAIADEEDDAVWRNLAQARLQARTQPVVVKATAPIAAAASLVELLSARLGGTAATDHGGPFIWAHAGSGIAFAACQAPPSVAVLAEVRQAVSSLGGNAALVIERCPVETKREIDIWGDVGSSLSLMQALKRTLDPRDTLNPGRYVGGI